MRGIIGGAIAVNETTGVVGNSRDLKDERSASREALRACKNNSNNDKYKLGNCIIVVTFYNSCGGAAWSFKTKTARAAQSNISYQEAGSSALARCKSMEQDSACKLVAQFCTKWETIESTTTTTWW